MMRRETTHVRMSKLENSSEKPSNGIEDYSQFLLFFLESLSPEDKAKVWFDKLLTGEIDLKTFKTGLDVLLPDKWKGEDIGYI